MIRLTFECPTTGEPLPTMRTSLWLSDADDVQVAMHCPRCSQLHRFTRRDAVLAVAGPPLAIERDGLTARP